MMVDADTVSIIEPATDDLISELEYMADIGVLQNGASILALIARIQELKDQCIKYQVDCHALLVVNDDLRAQRNDVNPTRVLTEEEREWINCRADNLFSEWNRQSVRGQVIRPEDLLTYWIMNATLELLSSHSSTNSLIEELGIGTKNG